MEKVLETLLTVTVLFFTVLRELTGRKRMRVELGEGSTLQDLLFKLADDFGEKFRNYVFDEKGNTRLNLQYLINGKSHTNLRGLRTELREGDVVAIVPPVGGGNFFALICNSPLPSM